MGMKWAHHSLTFFRHISCLALLHFFNGYDCQKVAPWLAELVCKHQLVQFLINLLISTNLADVLGAPPVIPKTIIIINQQVS